MKPVITRKLRRRPNDPPPAQDKRPKRATEISQLLDEEDIVDDLRVIFKVLEIWVAEWRVHCL